MVVRGETFTLKMLSGELQGCQLRYIYSNAAGRTVAMSAGKAGKALSHCQKRFTVLVLHFLICHCHARCITVG